MSDLLFSASVWCLCLCVSTRDDCGSSNTVGACLFLPLRVATRLLGPDTGPAAAEQGDMMLFIQHHAESCRPWLLSVPTEWFWEMHLTSLGPTFVSCIVRTTNHRPHPPVSFRAKPCKDTPSLEQRLLTAAYHGEEASGIDTTWSWLLLISTNDKCLVHWVTSTHYCIKTPFLTINTGNVNYVKNLKFILVSK